MNALLVVAALAQMQVAAPEIENTIRPHIDSGFSGVVLVTHGDVIVFNGAYGQAGEQPTMADSRFSIGAMTRAFTSAAILLLQHEGRLSLADSIGRFFADAPADKRGITIAQLLRNISGLDARPAATDIETRAEAVRAILAPPLARPPGTFYRYMDNDFVLLAAIVEVASGRSWEEYLRRTILVPLELVETGFQRGDWSRRGASGMVSTAPDLLLWIRAIESGRVGGTTVSIELRRPLLRVRQQPPYDVFHGYGTRVYVRDRRVVELVHAGRGEEGHSAIARVLEDGDVIIVLSNAARSGMSWASSVATTLRPR